MPRRNHPSIALYRPWFRLMVAAGLGVTGFSLDLSLPVQPWPSHAVFRSISQVIAMPRPLLNADSIRDRIQTLPGWTTDGKALYTTRKFKNFVEAVAFVNKLVEPAEAANHHPDISINYNKVPITLTTHDSGGLTELDFQLAHQISAIDE